MKAFIIDKIQRERKRREEVARRLPLYVPPPPPPRFDEREREQAPERGVVEIDFTI